MAQLNNCQENQKFDARIGCKSIQTDTSNCFYSDNDWCEANYDQNKNLDPDDYECYYSDCDQETELCDDEKNVDTDDVKKYDSINANVIYDPEDGNCNDNEDIGNFSCDNDEWSESSCSDDEVKCWETDIEQNADFSDNESSNFGYKSDSARSIDTDYDIDDWENDKTSEYVEEGFDSDDSDFSDLHEEEVVQYDRYLSPLEVAIRSGDYEMIKNILKQDCVNINQSFGEEQYTAMHISVISNKYHVMKLLIKFNAYVNAKDSIGETPLHKACKYGFSKSVKKLLEAGADINVQNNFLKTPLHVCMNAEVLKALLLGQPNLFLRERMGYTAFELFELNDEKLKDTYLSCLNEIIKIKATKITNKKSLYDILYMKPMFASRFTRNQNILKILKGEEESFKKEFFNYGTLIDSIYQKAESRRLLQEEASETLKLIINYIYVPELCILEIFKYLNNLDLINIIKTKKNIDVLL